MSRRTAKREQAPVEESDYSDEDDQSEEDDKEYSEEEGSYEEESSVEEDQEEEAREEESGLAEILCESLDHLKEEYDQLIQQKLQELESKKNIEIQHFKEQEKVFKEELQILRKERQDSAQIIKELQAQLTAQRVEFDRNLADLRAAVN